MTVSTQTDLSPEAYWKGVAERALRDGVEAGLNFVQIAEVMGKNAKIVSSKAYRLGLRSGQPCDRTVSPVGTGSKT